ncbi:unnamed protein product, partial [Phaeothamnion confervicola]
FDSKKENLHSWLSSWPMVLQALDATTVELRRRKISGPYSCAMRTVELLRMLIGSCRWSTAGQLMEVVREVGRELVRAKPTELAVGNVVRRVMHVIREEYASKLREALQAEFGAADGAGGAEMDGLSLGSMLAGGDSEAVDYGRNFPDLKQNIIEGVNELKDELKDANSHICDSAADTIHANEVILTFGYSSTVEAFLKAAAAHHAKLGLSFQVVVAEAAPGLKGHEMGRALANARIEATVISDSAVFAIMARVNKVILSTHAVVANGGLVAGSGSHLIALAARELSVPVVCVTGLYKLCTLFPHDQDTFNCMLAPSAVMPYRDADAMPSAEVVNPAYDYVPPDLVDLYITNGGRYQPSYIYRLLAEYYHRDDYLLFEEAG